MDNQNNPSKDVKKTWGAKISVELREQIDNITEATGMKGEELLTNLIESFDLNQTKLAAPKFTNDIENIERYTMGIVSCIKNVVATSTDMEKMNEEKSYKKLRETEIELNKIKEEILKLKDKNKELDEQNIKYWNEKRQAEESLNELKKSNEENTIKNKEIMELKDSLLKDKDSKINNLNEEVSLLVLQIKEDKKYKDDVTLLKSKIVELEKLSFDKTNDIKLREIEVNGLTSQINFFKDQLAILKAEHKEELKGLKVSMKQDCDDKIKMFEKMLEEYKDKKKNEIIE